jgi:hypothetical protein
MSPNTPVLYVERADFLIRRTNLSPSEMLTPAFSYVSGTRVSLGERVRMSHCIELFGETQYTHVHSHFFLDFPVLSC